MERRKYELVARQASTVNDANKGRQDENTMPTSVVKLDTLASFIEKDPTALKAAQFNPMADSGLVQQNTNVDLRANEHQTYHQLPPTLQVAHNPTTAVPAPQSFQPYSPNFNTIPQGQSQRYIPSPQQSSHIGLSEHNTVQTHPNYPLQSPAKELAYARQSTAVSPMKGSELDAGDLSSGVSVVSGYQGGLELPANTQGRMGYSHGQGYELP